MTRLEALAIWLDQGLSAVILKSPDETFSAAAYRLAQMGDRKWVFIQSAIDSLFFWQDAHCYEAWVSEYERKHLPLTYRA